MTMRRREALERIGTAVALVAAGCGGASDTPASPTSATTPIPTSTGTPTTSGACVVAPNETAGPFPSLSDMFRSDIREGRPGTNLTLTIKVGNTNSGCAGVSGANVEIWQCDVAGNYSQYGSQAGQTYLRGIQTSNANGEVIFTTLYPGWYQGRATHIHIEVTIAGRVVKTTQIAFPESINDVVHTQGVYASRGTNPTTNLRDGIFADSLASELVTPVGSPAAGYVASYLLGVPL